MLGSNGGTDNSSLLGCWVLMEVLTIHSSGMSRRVDWWIHIRVSKKRGAASKRRLYITLYSQTPSLVPIYHLRLLVTCPATLTILGLNTIIIFGATKNCKHPRHVFFSGVTLKIHETDNKFTVSHDTRVTSLHVFQYHINVTRRAFHSGRPTPSITHRLQTMMSQFAWTALPLSAAVCGHHAREVRGAIPGPCAPSLAERDVAMLMSCCGYWVLQFETAGSSAAELQVMRSSTARHQWSASSDRNFISIKILW
jgi:hypothetical protein